MVDALFRVVLRRRWRRGCCRSPRRPARAGPRRGSQVDQVEAVRSMPARCRAGAGAFPPTTMSRPPTIATPQSLTLPGMTAASPPVTFRSKRCTRGMAANPSLASADSVRYLPSDARQVIDPEPECRQQSCERRRRKPGRRDGSRTGSGPPPRRCCSTTAARQRHAHGGGQGRRTRLFRPG